MVHVINKQQTKVTYKWIIFLRATVHQYWHDIHSILLLDTLLWRLLRLQLNSEGFRAHDLQLLGQVKERRPYGNINKWQ